MSAARDLLVREIVDQQHLAMRLILAYQTITTDDLFLHAARETQCRDGFSDSASWYEDSSCRKSPACCTSSQTLEETVPGIVMELLLI